MNPVITEAKTPPRNFSRVEIASELKKNLPLTLFFLSPSIRPSAGWQELARMVGVSEAEGAEYRDLLLGAGLWREAGGRVEKTTDCFDLGDLSISEYLTMCLNVVARLSETGPCRYESFVLVTNEKLKREFYKKIDKAFRELVENSAKEEGDTLLAWNYAALDCLKALHLRKDEP